SPRPLVAGCRTPAADGRACRRGRAPASDLRVSPPIGPAEEPRYSVGMGLSFDFLVYSNSGSVDLRRPSDEAEAQAVIRRLYPRTAYERIGTGRLLDVCRQP